MSSELGKKTQLGKMLVDTSENRKPWAIPAGTKKPAAEKKPPEKKPTTENKKAAA